VVAHGTALLKLAAANILNCAANETAAETVKTVVAATTNSEGLGLGLSTIDGSLAWNHHLGTASGLHLRRRDRGLLVNGLLLAAEERGEERGHD